MKLINNSGKFSLSYDGKSIDVPDGEFKEENEGLAYHMIAMANKWGKDVKIVHSCENKDCKQCNPVKEVKKEIKEEVKKEVKKVGAVKKVIKKVKGKK